MATITSFRYSSTIDGALNGLYAKVCIPSQGASGLPILVMQHGYSTHAQTFDEAVLEQYAEDWDCLVVAFGKRWSDGDPLPTVWDDASSAGWNDMNAREIHDIYDGINEIRSRYQMADVDRVTLMGYSGGGADALSIMTKFPDLCVNIIDFFGISDFGYDAAYGWYQQNFAANPDTRKKFQAHTGYWPGTDPTDSVHPDYAAGTGKNQAAIPSENRNAYMARASVLAMKNYTGGHLRMFHHEIDTDVDPSHSANVKAAFDALGMTNYDYHLSLTSDQYKWTHGYPLLTNDVGGVAPLTWGPDVRDKTYPVWTVPITGTIKVLGYIVTKRFQMWLGTPEATVSGWCDYRGIGTEHAADIEYDAADGVYKVTPLTGLVKVTVNQNGVISSKTISGESFFDLGLWKSKKSVRVLGVVSPTKKAIDIGGDGITSLTPFQINTVTRTVNFSAQTGDVMQLVASDSRITFTDTGSNPITSITAASDGVQSVSIKVLVDLTTDTSELYATWSLIGSEDHTSAAFNVSTNVLTVSGRKGFRAYLADGSGGWTFIKRAPQHSSDLDLTGLLSDGWNEIMIRPGTLDGPDIWLGWVWYSVVSESVQRLAAEPVARHKAKAVSYTHDAGKIVYTHDAAAVGYTHAAEG